MATPITVASVVTNPGGTGSNIVPTLPSHQADDVIEIFVGKTGNVAWSAPAGWTIKHQSIVGTSSNGTVGTLLYRRVLSTDSLPLPNPTCNLGATVTRGAIAITKRGADTESVYNSASWGATSTTTGTANPIRPFSVVTPAPEMLVHHYYCQRTATNAPEPTGYTEDQQIIISGTLVLNVSEKNVADQQTTLNNQDASPTSGARWVGMISCTPSSDYPYYRAGSQATTASGTSVTPAKPTGTTDNDTRGNADVMIITVEGSGSTTLAMADTGLWNEVGGAWSGTTGGGGSSVKKFWCYATLTPNMQATRTGTGEISACVTTYYNCDQSNPIGVFDADARASSSAPTFDAITRGSTKSVVTATVVADGTPTFAFPGGWTERMDGLGIGCGDQTYNAVGDSASGSIGLSAASPTLIGLLELIGIASASLTTLTPANVSLVLSSFTPKLVLALTPANSSLSLSTFAPTVSVSGGETVLTPAIASLTATGFAPKLATTISPASASFAVSGFAPSLRTAITPSSASLTLTTFAPSVTTRVIIPATALTLATFAPSVTMQVVVSPSTASLGLNSFTPALRATVTPANQSLTLTVFAPQLREIITPAIGTLSLEAFASAVEISADVAVVPATAALTVSGLVPSLQERVTLSTAALVLTTFTPSITISADIVVSPPVVALTLTSLAPTLHEILTPNVSVLALSTFAPTVTTSADITVEPATQTLTISSFASSLQVSLTPSAGLLSLTTLVPSVRSGTELIPITQTLIISRFSPRLELRVFPPVKSLILTGFAPSVEGSETVFYPRNVFNTSRESRILRVSREGRIA